MRLTDDRRQMVLAVRFKPDIAQHYHLIVVLDLFKGALEVIDRVAVIAGEPFLERARHSARCAEKTLARRIISGPAQQRPYSLLCFGTAGPMFLIDRLDDVIGHKANSFHFFRPSLQLRPVTGSAAPWTARAASELRNRTTLARSPGDTQRAGSASGIAERFS